MSGRVLQGSGMIHVVTTNYSTGGLSYTYYQFKEIRPFRYIWVLVLSTWYHSTEHTTIKQIAHSTLTRT